LQEIAMTRRNFVFGLSVSALVLAAGIAPDPALAQGRGPQIIVDVRPLAARIGGGGVTEFLRQRLQQSMAQAFAGRGGPPITVRIFRMSLAAATYTSWGGSGTDYLEGEIIAGGRSIPMLVTQNADSAGYWRAPNFDQQRVSGLAEAFAGWAKRKV
jgi:hypothetical protein